MQARLRRMFWKLKRLAGKGKADPREGKYLVVAPPRGGFTLLLSVLNIMYRDRHKKKSLVQETINRYIPIAGNYLDAVIRNYFRGRIDENDLFYSREFSILVGGPKWITKEDPDSVCVRKYLGVKGKGDFTFLLYLPRFALEFDDVIHSHNHPAKWLEMPDYADFHKFSSVRNPIDILHSSVYSINALASEYIQRCIGMDEHVIRRELALNKLTNLEFIEGLIKFYVQYWDEFLRARDGYDYVMKWEELIADPERVIREIAVAAGEKISAGYARQIWSEIDHRNLTRFHQHSFRKGKLNDWKQSITNSHLRLFEKYGFNEYLKQLGYPEIKYFDESQYNDTQKLIEEHIRRGTPYKEHLDQDLITFAFNKTNFLTTGSYNFKEYPRSGCLQIEKSMFRDEPLLEGFIERMGEATDVVYRFLIEVREAAMSEADGNPAALQALAGKYAGTFAVELGSEAENMFVQAGTGEAAGWASTPQLIQARGKYNIVKYKADFIAVPQYVGPLDLASVDYHAIAGIKVAATLREVTKLIEKA